MDIEIKNSFMEKWEKYFPGNELPIACFYSDELNGVEFPEKQKPNKRGHICIFSQLAPVRRGRSRAFNMENLGCWGAGIAFGFDKNLISDQLVDFLVNVERYKKAHVENMDISFLTVDFWDDIKSKNKSKQ